MFSRTHTAVFAGIALLIAGLAVPGVAAASSTTTATADTMDVHRQSQPEANNSTDAESAGWGILTAERGETDTNATSIERQLAPGLVVTSIDYRDGFALLTVVNSRAQPATLTITDSNSYDVDGGGSFEVAQETYTLPRGRFEMKVPASSDRGDQTIVVASSVMDSPIGFTDTGSGGGILQKVGSGWLPWALGGATAFTYIFGVAYLVLAGERTGVRKAGGTI